MILGEFTRSDQALLPLTIVQDGEAIEINAAIDTGFVGALLLPSSLVRRLGLPEVERETVMLADGSLTRMTLHEVTVLWGEEERVVAAHRADNGPLLGVELLRGSVGNIEFFAGGAVTIDTPD